MTLVGVGRTVEVGGDTVPLFSGWLGTDSGAEGLGVTGWWVLTPLKVKTDPLSPRGRGVLGVASRQPAHAASPAMPGE